MSESRFRKGDWTNCRYDICEIIDEDDEVVCIVSLNDADKIIKLLEENELLKAKADTLTKWAKNLEKRLEKINGGYGHLTHRNGLTANEWLIESQERELKKKNEQISDWIERHSKDIAKIGEQQATIQSLKEENKKLKNIHWY